VAPEGDLQRRGQTELDGGVGHRGARGEQIGGVDAQIARFAGQAPRLVDGLYGVALLELGEIGVALRGVGRAIGLEDATIFFEDTPPQDAARVLAQDGCAGGLRIGLHVGGAAHPAHVEHAKVHQAPRIDVVALVVGEDHGGRVGHHRVRAIGCRHPLGHAREGRKGIFPGRKQEGRDAKGRIPGLGRGRQELAHQAAIQGHRGERPGDDPRRAVHRPRAREPVEGALSGEHGPIRREGGRAIASDECIMHR